MKELKQKLINIAHITNTSLSELKREEEFLYEVVYHQCSFLELQTSKSLISLSLLKQSQQNRKQNPTPVLNLLILVDQEQSSRNEIEKTFFSFSPITSFIIEDNNKIVCGTKEGNVLIYYIEETKADSFLDITSLYKRSEIGESIKNKETIISYFEIEGNSNSNNINSRVKSLNNYFKLPNFSLSLENSIISITKNKHDNKSIIILVENDIIIIPSIESLIIASEAEFNFQQENFYKNNLRRLLNSNDSRNTYANTNNTDTAAFSIKNNIKDLGKIVSFKLNLPTSGYLLTNKYFCYLDFSNNEIQINYSVIDFPEQRENYDCINDTTLVNYFELATISDNKNVLLVLLKDNTIKLFEEVRTSLNFNNNNNGNNNNKMSIKSRSTATNHIYLEELFTAYNDCLSTKATIINSYFSELVCLDNITNKLLRYSCISNFFLLLSNGEFIIYDLNQDKTKTRKAKKSIKLINNSSSGSNSENNKVSLSSLSMKMLETTLTDYSNMIISINNKCYFNNDSNRIVSGIKFHKLSLRDKYFEINKIKKINSDIINKLKNC